MGVLDELLAAVAADATAEPVRRVAVGVYYTAVESSAVGLAATEVAAACCEAPNHDWMGDLGDRSAAELLGLVRSADPLETSIGLAALNSLVTVPQEATTNAGALELLAARGRGRHVVTVGHFPFTDELRSVAGRLDVLELHPRPGDLPAGMAPDVLAAADVVGITGTTLLNGTFDRLERHLRPNAYVVMVGPTTPLHPLLFDHRVDVLAGSAVTEPDALFRSLTQGASRRELRGWRRVTVARDPVAAGLARSTR